MHEGVGVGVYAEVISDSKKKRVERNNRSKAGAKDGLFNLLYSVSEIQ